MIKNIFSVIKDLFMSSGIFVHGTNDGFMYISLHLKNGLLPNFRLLFFQNFCIPLNFCLQVYFRLPLKFGLHLNFCLQLTLCLQNIVFSNL